MRFLSFIVSALLLLSACETVKGVGRDVENAGEALDEVF
jgi:predicted small secreted protein